MDTPVARSLEQAAASSDETASDDIATDDIAVHCVQVRPATRHTRIDPQPRLVKPTPSGGVPRLA